MKTFTSQIESHTQTRHSHYSRLFMTTTFALMFVMIGLPQAALAQICPPIQEGTIKECCIISSPGQYSLGQDLDRDLNCPDRDEALIGISVSDVYLNLNGYTISGPGCGSRSGLNGITVQPGAVTIHNIHIVGGSDDRGNKGTVKGFDIGILVRGVQGGPPAEATHLSGLTLTENCNGLILLDTNANQVSGNNIFKNAQDGDGVVLQRSNHNVIDKNVLNDNRGGVSVFMESDDNTITNNQFSRNISFGVFLDNAGGPGSNQNTIRNNTIEDGADWGIRVDNGSNNTFQCNTLRRNRTGIELRKSPEGLFVGSQNFVYGNTALGNDLDLRDGNPDCINTWTNNTYGTKDGPPTALGEPCIQPSVPPDRLGCTDKSR